MNPEFARPSVAIAVSKVLAGADRLLVTELCSKIFDVTKGRLRPSPAQVFSILYDNWFNNREALKRDKRGRWTLAGPLRVDGLYLWQHMALDSWRANKCRGIVQAVTGTGKTRIAIEAARAHLANGGRVAIIVPTIDLMDQWGTEINRHLHVPYGRCGGTYRSRIDLNLITLFVAASAGKHLPQQLERFPRLAQKLMLVADECHRYGTEELGQVLTSQYASTLGITATLKRTYDDGVTRFITPGLGPVQYTYDYEDALADRVIATFGVALVKISFLPHEQATYDDVSNRIAETYKLLRCKHPDLDDSKFFFKYLKAKADSGDVSALTWLSLIQQRRQVLIGAEARLTFIKWLASEPVWKRKVVLFHESIKHCEALSRELTARGISAESHNSSLTKLERRALLERFRHNDLQALIAARTLDEGIDVPDASLGIIVARTAVERQSIQRAGRILRRANGKKRAQIIVLVVNGSKDDPDSQRDDFTDGMRRLGLLTDFSFPFDDGRLSRWLQLPEN